MINFSEITKRAVAKREEAAAVGRQMDEEFNPSPESRFLIHAIEGTNTFLTGQAGTGKSTLLKRFLEAPQVRGKVVAVTAPTGIAALNVGGTTVHRWSGMMLGPGDGETNEAAADRLATGPTYDRARKRVRDTDVLVIDEVSMLSGQHFGFLDLWLRRLRGQDAPFGGIQVVALGDFLQLPPVRIDMGKPYDWAFRAPEWEAADFKRIKLTQVRRQDEPVFVQALSGFRIGSMTMRDAEALKSRVIMFPAAHIPRLFTHNAQVDKWNAYRLSELETPEVLFTAETSGLPQALEFFTKNLLTPSRLLLKVGCWVMFTANDNQAGFFNGQQGRVVEIREQKGIVVVEAVGGRVYEVERKEWAWNEGEVQFIQFPLRLAYALTIHKAQGMTLDAAYVDIRAAREPGQAYVALSRVRTLAGLHLKEWPKGWFVSDEAIEFEKATEEGGAR